MDITTHTERERQSPGCEGGVSKDDVILGDDDDDDGELLVAVEEVAPGTMQRSCWKAAPCVR